jgi:cytochrome b subunit of formate dehydrogenase
MWFAKETAPAGLLQWMVFVHDVAFIVAGTMYFVHMYLVFHPVMGPLKKGSWSAMTRGTVTEEYARTRHARWYRRLEKTINLHRAE